MIFSKFKKPKNSYYCFYDSEFNAYDDNKNMNIPQEVVSIGICITNYKGVIIEKFYSLISLKAAKRISNRCTDELYDNKRSGKYIAKLLHDVREDFKKKTRGKVWEQGLPFLKSICEIEGPVIHDALQDAIDLALIYHKLNTSGYNEEVYEKLNKEREELISYKRNRRVKEENATVVSADLVKSKNKLVDYLEKNDILHMDAGAKRAIIDDLNILFIGE